MCSFLLCALFRAIQLVSPSGRDVAQRQRGQAPSLRELDLPQAKTEGVLQIDKIRMRFALTRICQRAAPSVTACAVPPSSGRKALVFRANQLVSPFGRDVAQRQRGQAFTFSSTPPPRSGINWEFYPSTAGAVPLPFQGRLNLAPLKGELSRSD